LLNKFKSSLRRTKRSVELIIETIPYPIMKTKIGDRGAFVDSADFGTTVFDLKDKKAIGEINNLTDEVLTILKICK
jgi:cellulose biosynthesis protein BcsQ